MLECYASLGGKDALTSPVRWVDLSDVVLSDRTVWPYSCPVHKHSRRGYLGSGTGVEGAFDEDPVSVW